MSRSKNLLDSAGARNRLRLGVESKRSDCQATWIPDRCLSDGYPGGSWARLECSLAVWTYISWES